MQDFTLSCYEKELWIRELLNLKRVNDNIKQKQYLLNTANGTRRISFVSIFGTVVDIAQKGEDEFKLYSVDDGTGIIACKHYQSGSNNNLDLLEDWSWQDADSTRNMSKSQTFGETSSMCDTIFNNRTVQKEEMDVVKRSRLQALESLRWSIVNSFRSSEAIEVGDTVCVHGRLYTYFGTNQIYVNAIRLITMPEELTLMVRKLQDSRARLRRTSSQNSQVTPTSSNLSSNKEVSSTAKDQNIADSEEQIPDDNFVECVDSLKMDSNVKPLKSPEVEKASPNLDSRRVSGLMTFDSVQDVRLAILRAPCTIPAQPPTPKVIPGTLYTSPVHSLLPPSFDTFGVSELSGSSSSDDDVLIPPTPPPAKRPKNI